MVMVEIAIVTSQQVTVSWGVIYVRFVTHISSWYTKELRILAETSWAEMWLKVQVSVRDQWLQSARDHVCGTWYYCRGIRLAQIHVCQNIITRNTIHASQSGVRASWHHSVSHDVICFSRHSLGLLPTPLAATRQIWYCQKIYLIETRSLFL